MTTMNRGQLTTLAAGESSAQLEKDTPAWRIARANEIFERVFGDDGVRAAYGTLDNAIADIHGWGEYLTELVTDQPEEFNGKGFLDEVSHVSRELLALAERLRGIDLDERAA